MTTKHRYAIRYGNGHGAEREDVGIWFTRAFDAEHALERFHDDDAGFDAYEIALATEGTLPHRWVWEKVPNAFMGAS